MHLTPSHQNQRGGLISQTRGAIPAFTIIPLEMEKEKEREREMAKRRETERGTEKFKKKGKLAAAMFIPLVTFSCRFVRR